MAEMNETPSGERVRISFFGRRNAGKSSIVNAVTGQELAVVSEVPGTTTDPVSKAMELLPLGPVLITDTPGFDDEGSLGELRVRKTKKILNRTDIAVLVADGSEGLKECDHDLIRLFIGKKIPYITVLSKKDICISSDAAEDELRVSALTGEGINELRERLAAVAPSGGEIRLIGDRIRPGDMTVLVVPIDKAAPKGRLILPQQQTIRDILDAGGTAVVARDTELREVLERLGRRPDLVITDSQVFGIVRDTVPEDVLLTSFSILMARRKGFLEAAVRGAAAIESLRDGDRILIAEGCTHHRQCGDIGTVKIPEWLREYMGRRLEFSTVSGNDFPEDISSYALVIHCGGCMLSEREVRYRMECAADQGVPVTNYGTMIAFVNGILKRSLEVFPELEALIHI